MDEFVPGEVSRLAAARIIDSNVTQLHPDPPRSSLLEPGKKQEGKEDRRARNKPYLDLCDFILLVWPRKLQ